MRENLIGYLLDALDPAEHQMVEAQLSRDPQLQRELELISRSLAPLAADKTPYEPPSGLARRTCEFVASQALAMVAPPAESRGRLRMADFVVAAGIFLAAAMLFFPALNQSRFAARVSGCKNNLRQIGMALANYSVLHNGYFPNVPSEGRLAVAGIYAPRLVETGFLADHQAVVCPASSLADNSVNFWVPTCKELEAAQKNELAKMHAQLGGSYGYNVGYVANGLYQPTKNLRRANFALMSDSPSDAPPYRSQNHGGSGQNVLFEDGHVQYMTTCNAEGCRDHIFTNDEGLVAPGLHVNDAVIGPSPFKPLTSPMDPQAER